MFIRLNKYLADAGYCSRRQADGYISAGLVLVNNKRATLGQKVDGDKDVVKLMKKKVDGTKKELIYYVLNKPRGVLSTTLDKYHRPTVLDYISKETRLVPVGRLDGSSEGLMLLTNDGDLNYKLTHPKFEHDKEYEVIVRYNEELFRGYEKLKESMERGMVIDGVLMQVKRLTNFKRLAERRAFFNVILHTGYNHQIRKMCSQNNLEVLTLRRIKIGKLDLNKLNLKPGEVKQVRKEDIV